MNVISQEEGDQGEWAKMGQILLEVWCEFLG